MSRRNGRSERLSDLLRPTQLGRVGASTRKSMSFDLLAIFFPQTHTDVVVCARRFRERERKKGRERVYNREKECKARFNKNPGN